MTLAITPINLDEANAFVAMRYRRLITFTLPEEGGASLRASGWRCLGLRRSGNWNVPSRPRIDTAEALRGQKVLWEAA